jgi:DNA-binding HxlR family transcriptional regulator
VVVATLADAEKILAESIMRQMDREFQKELDGWEAKVAKEIITMLATSAGLIRRKIFAMLYSGPKTYAELKKVLVFSGNKELGTPPREYRTTDTTLTKHLNQLLVEKHVTRKRSFKTFPPKSVYTLDPKAKDWVKIYAVEDEFFQAQLERLLSWRIVALSITRARKSPRFWDTFINYRSMFEQLVKGPAGVDDMSLRKTFEYLENPERLASEVETDLKKILTDLITSFAVTLSTRAYEMISLKRLSISEGIRLCNDQTIKLYPHLFYFFLALWISEDVYFILGKNAKDLREFATILIEQKLPKREDEAESPS